MIESVPQQECANEALPFPPEYSPDVYRALRLWIALARSAATFSRALAARLADLELTLPQFGVLEALYHLGPLPLGELADKLLVTGGNVTFVMNRLEEQGLVTRARCEEDRRVVRACLTPLGHERIAEIFPGHADYVHELAGQLDPEEQELLRNLLRKLGKGIAALPQEG